MCRDDLMTAAELMSFNEYQVTAHTTASYEHPFYLYWGLMEEAAEVSKLVGKQMLRGDDKPAPSKEDVIAELGDCLWMISEIATQQGASLQSVADYNIRKLAGRAARGTIHGDGDKR